MSVTPTPRQFPYAIDPGLVDRARQQTWFVADATGTQVSAASPAASQLRTQHPDGVSMVIGGLFALAQKRRGSEVPERLERLSLSDDQAGFAAAIYHNEAAAAAADTTPRSWQRDGRTLTKDEVGRHFARQAHSTAERTAAVVQGGRSMALGPRVSSVLKRHITGQPLSVADAALAARVLTHELTHVTAPATEASLQLGEGVAEMAARNAELLRETARAIGLPDTPEVIDLATSPLPVVNGDMQPGDPRIAHTTYEQLYRGARDVTRRAGLDPDSAAVVRRLTSRRMPETARLLAPAVDDRLPPKVSARR